ncbi:MAG TPA: peroxiredoxin [Micromonosporaceae bacterium]|nr:peroxiredoxin [Micromonosporaceae bacterium]
MAKPPDIGTTAPDFTLPSVTVAAGIARRGNLTLSAERGHPVVLAFYPGDDTPVCTRQLCAYTSELSVFTDLNATVWAISPQTLHSHETFARRNALGFPLLADTEKAVIDGYGVGMFGIGVRRSVFVIDATGVVRWRFIGLVGLRYPTVATIATAVEAARAPFEPVAE